MLQYYDVADITGLKPGYLSTLMNRHARQLGFEYNGMGKGSPMTIETAKRLLIFFFISNHYTPKTALKLIKSFKGERISLLKFNRDVSLHVDATKEFYILEEVDKLKILKREDRLEFINAMKRKKQWNMPCVF